MYKFLRLIDGHIKSDNGDMIWTVGEWQSVKGKLDLCKNGLHCSDEPLDALGYVAGEVLAQVEGDGKKVQDDDKYAFQKLRLTDARLWTKKDSVALSIFTAELCLENFEKFAPNDDRPRKAIEAAKKWLAKPTKKNELSARSAARSAESAARSAESAARSAKYDEALKDTEAKINTWMRERFLELEPANTAVSEPEEGGK